MRHFRGKLLGAVLDGASGISPQLILATSFDADQKRFDLQLHSKLSVVALLLSQRPHHTEHTSSRPITEVKQC